MAAPAVARPTPALFAVRDWMTDPTLRLSALVFVVATFGEAVALTEWLRALRDQRMLAAIGWLCAGFAVERIVVAYWLRTVYGPRIGVQSSPLPTSALLIAVATIVEFGIWGGAYWIAIGWNAEIAGLLLFVTIHVLHAFEMAGVRREPLVKILVRPRTVLFSFSEAVGGALLLGLVLAGHPTLGAIAILIGLAGEHVVQGTELTREVV